MLLCLCYILIWKIPILNATIKIFWVRISKNHNTKIWSTTQKSFVPRIETFSMEYKKKPKHFYSMLMPKCSNFLERERREKRKTGNSSQTRPNANNAHSCREITQSHSFSLIHTNTRKHFLRFDTSLVSLGHNGTHTLYIYSIYYIE